MKDRRSECSYDESCSKAMVTRFPFTSNFAQTPKHGALSGRAASLELSVDVLDHAALLWKKAGYGEDERTRRAGAS